MQSQLQMESRDSKNTTALVYDMEQDPPKLA